MLACPFLHMFTIWLHDFFLPFAHEYIFCPSISSTYMCVCTLISCLSHKHTAHLCTCRTYKFQCALSGYLHSYYSYSLLMHTAYVLPCTFIYESIDAYGSILIYTLMPPCAIELVFIYLLPMPTLMWSFLLTDSYLMIFLLYIHLICISSYTVSLNLLSICIFFMLSYMSAIRGCLCPDEFITCWESPARLFLFGYRFDYFNESKLTNLFW